MMPKGPIFDIFLSLGSNIEPEKNIDFAKDQLQIKYGRLSISSIYKTKAVGFIGDHFLNLVIKASTDDDPQLVIDHLHYIERQTGRETGTGQFNSRTLDIDLLLYGDLIDPSLNLPRDEILKYNFVLEPLAEIFPEGMHPTENKSYKEIFKELRASVS
tara:strand:- start:7 stop:480 length:474 start_codon:yes stop_codon:yes gene_type:complete